VGEGELNAEKLQIKTNKNKVGLSPPKVDGHYLMVVRNVGWLVFNSHSTHYRSFWGRFYKPYDQTNSVKALK